MGGKSWLGDQVTNAQQQQQQQTATLNSLLYGAPGQNTAGVSSQYAQNAFNSQIQKMLTSRGAASTFLPTSKLGSPLGYSSPLGGPTMAPPPSGAR